ncbi:hypothetical protein [Actinocorallia aurantiaca]|uniref:Neocarzinostatin family protein n=1 Tax=Actinocorallia aurantiaca TaxID=46204 RepID=A0ABN3UR08_9ACTN
MKRVLVVAGVAAMMATMMPGTALAQTEKGKKPKLTVSTDVVAPTGRTAVTVKGSGYDPKKGVYVALCQDNGAGQKPGPCYGGREGTSQAWVSGSALSQSMGASKLSAKGTFSVKLTVAAKGEGLDCTKVKCVLASRNDHFATEDRGQDVLIPARVGRLGASKFGRLGAKKGRLNVVLTHTLNGKKATWGGQRVYFELKKKGKWVRVASALTSANGTAKAKANKKGTYRAVFTGTKKAVSKTARY